MNAARALVLLVGVPLLLLLMTATAAWLWVQSAFPPPQGPRVRGPHELVGIRSGPSYLWVIPSATGVVLIDAGFEPDGLQVRQEVHDRPIHAVLLTHAHPGHTLGLDALPAGVPVYGSAEDLEMLAGRAPPRSWVARWVASAVPLVQHQGPRVVVTDGEELHIDGLRILAQRVPGHTPGSTSYLWEEVLFTGDAVLGGPGLAHAPEITADDPPQAAASLQRLAQLDFEVVADGHVGLTTAARPPLLRLAGLEPTEPTRSVRTIGPLAAVPAEREGLYQQWPWPDVRGDQPAVVVFDDGTSWRLSDQPVPEHAEWVGRRVVVSARPAPAGGPVEWQSVRAAEEPGAARPLADRVGELVELEGEVRDLQPLGAGARWGSGELVLADGGTLELAAPLASVVDGRIRGVALLKQGNGDQLRAILLPPPAVEAEAGPPADGRTASPQPSVEPGSPAEP
jgi:hydroxyacylglutathione hydrolase